MNAAYRDVSNLNECVATALTESGAEAK